MYLLRKNSSNGEYMLSSNEILQLFWMKSLTHCVDIRNLIETISCITHNGVISHLPLSAHINYIMMNKV